MNTYFSYIVFLLILGSVASCSNADKKSVVQTNEVPIHAPYDTIAVDSFSEGAISVDVAQQIRMSSQKYQDSLQQILKQQEEEKKIKEELEKEKKKQAEVDKKKTEVEKKNVNNSASEPKTK